jgi:hypothetical protein
VLGREVVAAREALDHRQVERQVADVVAVGGLQAGRVDEAAAVEHAPQDATQRQRVAEQEQRGGGTRAQRVEAGPGLLQRRGRARPHAAAQERQRRRQREQGAGQQRARAQPEHAPQHQREEAQQHGPNAEAGRQPRQRRQRERHREAEGEAAQGGGEQEGQLHVG